MKKSLISLAVLLGLSTGVQAGGLVHQQSLGGGIQGAQFASESSLRAQPMLVADRGVSRSTTITNRAGMTAERNMNRSVDSEARTATRTVNGTTFRGEAYSGASTTQRTADGYVRSSTQTGPNGNTRTREVEAQVDRENNTITKDVSVTGPNGEVRNTTVVKHYERSGGSADTSTSVTAE